MAITNHDIVGREREKRLLEELYDSSTSEFLAIYGSVAWARRILFGNTLVGKRGSFSRLRDRKTPLRESNSITSEKRWRALFTTTLLLGGVSGGRLNTRLKELEEAGFIAAFTPYQKRVKQTSYRVIDEYSYFYLKWIEPAPKKIFLKDADSYWLLKSQSPSFKSWAGYAFEGICLKHSYEIKRALNIDSIGCETATWRFVSPPNTPRDKGAQIDLLFDRADGIISVCEVKFRLKQFVLDKSTAGELKRKISIFEEKSKTRKEIFVVLITPAGLKRNSWSEDLVTNVVELDDLFK